MLSSIIDSGVRAAARTIAAVVAAILSAVIVVVSVSKGASRPATLVRRGFQKRYKDALVPDKPEIAPLAQSEESAAIYPLNGWGWEARWSRARRISDLLAPAQP